MPLSVPNVLALVERMEARKEKGFGVSPQTAPLIIEALRVYARMHAGEPAKYKVERWDSQDAHVEEIVATASLILVGHAAFANVSAWNGREAPLVAPPISITALWPIGIRALGVNHRSAIARRGAIARIR